MRTPRHGFTLVEMLVALSILSLMMVFMTRLIGVAEQYWRAEQDRIDNFTKARSMLDLVTDDLQRAVYRGDLPIFGTGGPAPTPALTGTGSYSFTNTTYTTAFYTRLAGATGSSSSSGTGTAVRNVSLVSYVLSSTNQGEDKIVLERGGSSRLIISYILPCGLQFEPVEVEAASVIPQA